jgi:hypothetical protein
MKLFAVVRKQREYRVEEGGWLYYQPLLSSARSLVLCSVILCTLTTGLADDKSGEKADLTDFNQPHNLAELLALKPEQLDRVDIALINLVCAEGLRGSENLDVQSCLDTLDAWAFRVKQEN